jgi:hypothetical protein
MVMSERSTVVGVFTEDLYAELAADELRRVGFSDDEISVLKHGAATVGFIDNLKSLFTGQETTTGATADDFIRMGVPEQDAGYYHDELDAGHAVLLVRVAGQEKEVLGILNHNGAMTSRRPDPNAHAETDHPNAAPGKYDPIANREADDYMPPPERPREP